MIKDVIRFCGSLIAQTLWQPQWLQSHQPDESHFHRRRFTDRYKQKQRLVRGLWLAVALISMAFPYPAVVVSLALFTTFVAFSILDETN